MSPAEPLEAPVFVGGTGRSGTTILARTLGHSDQLAMIPFELKFHTDTWGLPDLLAEDATGLDRAATMVRFLHRLMTHWFRRPSAHGDVGLCEIASGGRVSRQALAFAGRFWADPNAASRQLMDRLVSPWAARAGATNWIEMTPASIYHAQLLRDLYPAARFVHIYRDGRDTAASIVRRPWGPDTLDDALSYWADGLRRADRATRTLPSDSLLEIDFSKFILSDREGTLDELCTFVGIPRQGPHREFFDEHVRARQANVERWKGQVDPPDRDAFRVRYQRLCDELRSEGLTCVPE